MTSIRMSTFWRSVICFSAKERGAVQTAHFSGSRSSAMDHFDGISFFSVIIVSPTVTFCASVLKAVSGGPIFPHESWARVTG
jgi:hypothetical protein